MSTQPYFQPPSVGAFPAQAGGSGGAMPPGMPGMGPQAGMSGPQPGYGQAPDPQTQAVWSEFPSTDPDYLAQMAQQAGSAEALLPTLVGLMDQDQEKLKAMQRQQLDAILHLMMAPSGPSQPPGPPLGVGGQSG